FAAVALAERFPVKIGPQQKINFGALPCLVAVLLLPPGLGPATAGLSVLAANRFIRRSWKESAYNAGNVLAAGALASMARAIEAQAIANDQLQAVLASQRRFLTDVSHQVATPLATIMTNLSILRRANRGGPSEDAVADSVAEAERMKRMLARLRSLAHADE